MLTNRQKAILHVAKSKLGLDDETYRSMLEAYGGVRSSRDLSYKGFKAVMRHFERSGFETRGKRAQDGAERNRPGMATGAEIRKIKALWLTLSGIYYDQGKEWRALRGFLRKRFRVEHENFLTVKKAHQVIEAIKKIIERKRA